MVFFRPAGGVTVVTEPNQQSHLLSEASTHVKPLETVVMERHQQYSFPDRSTELILNHEVSLYRTNLRQWTTVPCRRPQPRISVPCPRVCPARHKCDECVATGYVMKPFLLRGWRVVHQPHLGRFQCLSWGLFIAPPDLFGLTSQR